MYVSQSELPERSLPLRHDRAGVDAARAFGTGCFKDHRTHDLRGLSESELKVNLLTHLSSHTRTPEIGRLTT
jgi:hypothetical protein